MAGKKGSQHYPREVKLEAIRLFYEEGKSRVEITSILQIRDPWRVKQWLHLYRERGETAFDKRPKSGLRGRPPKKTEMLILPDWRWRMLS